MNYYSPSVRNLFAIKRYFTEHPDGKVPMDWCTSYDREEWSRFFVECLNRKINRNETPRGRKDCPEWFNDMRRASRDLNRPRLAIHWLPMELRNRFAHRISDAA
jgi:hypothetical protein